MYFTQLQYHPQQQKNNTATTTTALLADGENAWYIVKTKVLQWIVFDELFIAPTTIYGGYFQQNSNTVVLKITCNKIFWDKTKRISINWLWFIFLNLKCQI